MNLSARSGVASTANRAASGRRHPRALHRLARRANHRQALPSPVWPRTQQRRTGTQVPGWLAGGDRPYPRPSISRFPRQPGVSSHTNSGTRRLPPSSGRGQHQRLRSPPVIAARRRMTVTGGARGRRSGRTTVRGVARSRIETSIRQLTDELALGWRWIAAPVSSAAWRDDDGPEPARACCQPLCACRRERRSREIRRGHQSRSFQRHVHGWP